MNPTTAKVAHGKLDLVPDVQIYENAQHANQRVRVDRARLQAERDQLRAVLMQVIEALPIVGGEEGRAIAEEALKALPAEVDVRDPTPQGTFIPARPAASSLPAAPQRPQLAQPRHMPAPQHTLPAQAGPDGTGAGAIIGQIPEGMPLDAFPPEFRQQAAQQSGRAPQQAQAQAQVRPAPRFGGPRQAPQQYGQGQPGYEQPSQQPGHPDVKVMRPALGLEDISFDGSNGRGGNVKIGRLAVAGQPAGPAPRAGAPAAPSRMSALQQAVARAKAAAGGESD